MKKTTYRTGNRVDIHTGHSTFDSQCDILTTGNVCANTQWSSYIRAYTETECNGFTNPPGHLRDFDLKPFRAMNIPQHVLDKVLAETQDKSIILYQIRHWQYVKGGEKVRVVHGYILTHGANNGHKLIAKMYCGKTIKSYDVINICAEYISEAA
jgi:hypothetical protein